MYTDIYIYISMYICTYSSRATIIGKQASAWCFSPSQIDVAGWPSRGQRSHLRHQQKLSRTDLVSSCFKSTECPVNHLKKKNTVHTSPNHIDNKHPLRNPDCVLAWFIFWVP